ncbi:MAG TPA: TatD family hydrolase [Acidimicrobiia bacterium]|nr:TatD family hydrolase [Acidimicrobiia bacterium]
MLVDAHTHLDKYGDDEIEEVLAAIERQRILTLTVADGPASFVRAEAIAARSTLVMAGFGIHPSVAHEYAESMDEVCKIANRSPFIGEVGLDYRLVTDEALYVSQRQVFAMLLDLARDQDKLVNVHCAGAEQDTADILRYHRIDRAIIHWYSGPLDILSELVTAGYMLSLGVEVMHSSHIRDVARAVPSDQLLTETDNPGGLRWLTGEVGQPQVISDIVSELATVRGVHLEELAATVQSNMVRLVEDDPVLGPWLTDLRL